MNRRAAKAWTAAVVMVSLIGCGGDDGEGSSSSSTFREYIEDNAGNMVDYASVDERLMGSTAVVDGAFESIEQGETIVESTGDVTTSDPTAVARIRVDAVLAGELPAGGDGAVHLRVLLAANESLDEVRQRFPEGNRAIIVLAPAATHEGNAEVTVENAGAGVAEGATLFSPLPQGYFFTDVDGAFAAPYGGGAEESEEAGIRFGSLDEAARAYRDAGA